MHKPSSPHADIRLAPDLETPELMMEGREIVDPTTGARTRGPPVPKPLENVRYEHTNNVINYFAKQVYTNTT